MLKRLILATAMIGLLGSGAAAAPKPKALVLKPGEYSATAKALVCSACAGEIEKTLKGFPGIKGVTVPPEGGAVRFKVKKATPVKLAALNDALKAASDKMGMGADYTLHDVKQPPKPER